LCSQKHWLEEGGGEWEFELYVGGVDVGVNDRQVRVWSAVLAEVVRPTSINAQQADDQGNASSAPAHDRIIPLHCTDVV